jgi:hypothetical protein
MGCSSSLPITVRERIKLFDIKNPIQMLSVRDKNQVIYTNKYNIGDHFTDDITDEVYFYFESRFLELIEPYLVKFSHKLSWSSKVSLVHTIIQDELLRRKIFKIIKRKGLTHCYRWDTWNVICNSDKDFKPKPSSLEKRKNIFKKLLKMTNKEVEAIVMKDILRTAKAKELFSNYDSLGTQKLFNVCKAIGCFFPKIGYVQGMNFIVFFILEISGLDEFHTFNFIINFWKKKKNLYFGLYEKDFPLLKFLTFSFHQILKVHNKKIFQKIQKMDIPDEFWITKWYLSFFILIFPKKYLLRIFDFLVVSDVFGLVYISIIITQQLESFFFNLDSCDLSQLLQNKEEIVKNMNYYKFLKSLKTIEIDNSIKKKILKDYNNSLDPNDKKKFAFFFENLKSNWDKKKPFYDDFEIAKTEDYDNLEFDKEGIFLSKTLYLRKIKNIYESSKKDFSNVLQPLHLNSISTNK